MKSRDVLLVGAGGGGGGGGSFRNRPDNLRSTDTFEAIIGLSSVRTRLAPGGLKNLFVNDVPVEDGQGRPSFTNFAAELFDGDPTILEPIKLRLGQSAGPEAINLTLDNSYPSGPGDWKNGAITIPGCDFIDLRFIVHQLYKQTKKGVGDNTATIEVELRPSGSSTWINPLVDLQAPTYERNGIQALWGRMVYVFEAWVEEKFPGVWQWKDTTPGGIKITGKTTSAYVKELRIAVPNEGDYANKTWEIRCRLRERDYLVSGDDGENEERRTIVWESATGVKSGEFGTEEDWRGVSWVSLFGKASDQISGVPEITGIYDLGRFSVPPDTVWDPVTREYTGETWDGATTIKAWTQCPAWQIKGLIEDDLSGVSALSPGSTLNKWDALEASKWFSELVPDGKGGEHPRYSLNWFLEEPMQVNELVNYLAGAVGARAWDEGDGRWRMKVERPETPQMIFTKENIVGEFVYSHTDFDSRINDFTGVFRNEEMRYREDRVRVWDQASIEATGRRHQTIALVGCTNRQEALRRLKIRLLTSLHETRMVTFVTNRQGLLLEPLDVIAIADGDLISDTSIRSTGRVIAISSDRKEITVRDPLRLEVGVNYTVSFTIPNPDYDPESTSEPDDTDWRKPTITITRSVTNGSGQRGDVTKLYLNSALPSGLPEYAPLALSATGLPSLPKQYRVTNVKPNEDGELVTISATEIYTSKWLESDNVTEEEFLNQEVERVVPPPVEPAGGMFNIVTYTSSNGERKVLTVDWERPASMFVDCYRLECSHNGGPWQDLGTTRDTFYEFHNPLPGIYTFRIYMLDRRGAESLPLVGTIDVDETILRAGDIAYEDGTPIEDLKPAEPDATNGAPEGTPVGDRNAEDVIDAIDSHTNELQVLYDDMAAAELQIQDLFETYGPTESAMNSAAIAEAAAQNAQTAAEDAADARDAAGLARDAAELHKQAAETAQATAETALSDTLSAKNAAQSAQNAAEQAKSDAEDAEAAAIAAATTAGGHATTASNKADEAAGYASAAAASATTATTKAGEATSSAASAATSASNAEGYKNAAATSATNAANSASTAQGHANAASSSASTAATHAGNAATSATAAQTAANTASTKAGEASTSASSAASSASTAQGYANTASTHASVAATSVPTGKVSPATHTRQHDGAPESASNAPTASDEYGTYVELTGNDDRLYQKAVHSYEPGRRYRIRARVRRVGNGTPPMVQAGRRTLQSDYTYSAIGWTSESLVDWEPQWFSWDTTIPTPTDPDAAYIRFCVRNNSGADASRVRVYAIFAEDITERYNADQSASAAASSASTATTKATEASTSASAAQAAATTATTKAGEATSSAASAATSASNAEGYKNAAATSATNAANSASTAQGHANAASSSASTAATHASDASISASAAQTAANTATTKAGEASTSASSAAASASSAEGHANTASSQATVAANSASAARLTAASLLPSNFSEDGKYWFNGYNGNPDTRTPVTHGNPAWVQFATVAGAGRVLRTQGSGGSAYNHVGQVGVIRWQPGMRLRAEARVKSLSGSQAAHVTLLPLDANYQYLNTGVVVGSATVGESGYSSVVAENTADLPAGTVWVRVSLRTPPASTNWLEWTELVVRDVTATKEAQGYASAAATSASTATTKATEASTSASAAQTAATTATTKAGEASTSASSAAASASTAQGHANTASSQATVAANSASAAQQVANQIFRSDFNNGADYWVGNYTQDRSQLASAPSVLSLTGMSLVDVAGAGKVLQGNGVYRIMSDRTTRPILPGQKIRVRFRTRLTQNPSSGTHTQYLWLIYHDYDGAYLGYQALTSWTGLTVAQGWVTREVVFEPSQRRTQPAISGTDVSSAPEWRLMVGINGYSTNVAGAIQQIQWITVEDVTAVEEAEDYASAAATSASTATTKATEASTSASAAQTAATTATTKAGEASTSASSAAASASTAQGHANTASSQATVAANAAEMARLTAASLLPERYMTGDERVFTNNAIGSPQSRPIVTSNATISGYGPVYQVSASGTTLQDWGPIGCVPAVAGRVYEVEGEFEVTAYSGSPRLGLFLRGLNDSYANITSNGVQQSITATGTYTLVQKFSDTSGSGISQWPAGSVWLRPFLRTNPNSGTATVRFKRVTIKDVTEREAAATSASAAATSASTASTQASNAATSATAANSAKVSAETAAGNASSSASAAAVSASTATSQANAAQTFATVAASVGNGALNGNAGFDDYPSASVGSTPTGWSNFLGSGAPVYRVADQQGGYAVRVESVAGVERALRWANHTDQSFTHNGWYVIEADVVLNSGTFDGAGVLLRIQNQDNSVQSYPSLNFGTEPDITGSVQSSPTVNRAYSFRKMFRCTVSDARGFEIRAYNHRTSFGSINSPNDITWRKCLVRPATETEIRDQTVYGPMSVTVTEHSSAIAAVEGDVATLFGKWGVQVDANGRVVGIALNNNGNSGSFDIHADYFTVTKPGGGAGLTWNNGTLWNRGTSTSVILGQNFGTSNNLLLWVGPNPASPAAASKANAIMWVDNAGNAYFGGTLAAGVLKNATQTTLTTADASVELGPFGSNGGTRSVTVSYQYRRTLTWSSSAANAPAAPTITGGSATFVLERWNGSSWVQMQTQTVNASNSPGELLGENFNWSRQGQSVMSGSFSVNDTTGGTSVRYRVRLTSRTSATVSSGSWTLGSDFVAEQVLSVISIEE